MDENSGNHEIEGYKARIEELEDSKIKLEDSKIQLEDSKIKLEEDFGQQRAKLKELFLQKERELGIKTEQINVLNAELTQNSILVQPLQREIDELRSQVMVAELKVENEVVEKQKHQDDIASLKQIYQESLESSTHDTYCYKKKIKELESEKSHYRSLYEQKLEEMEVKREDSILSPGMLSNVTKSLVKRVPTLSMGDKSLDGTLSKEESLEDTMIKAQENNSILKSLVVPLEEEIAALKNKIREQDAQLRVKEAEEALALKTSDIIGPLFQGSSLENVVHELDKKLMECSEISSKSEMELCIAILSTQKSAMADQIDRQREQLNDLRKSQNDIRKEHIELKKSWQTTNDQLLVNQRRYLRNVQSIKSLLNSDQNLKLNDILHTKKEKDAIDFEGRLTPLQSSEDASIDASASCDRRSSDLLGRDLDSEKMPRLTDDQKSALSENVESTQKDSCAKSPSRLVSEEEWLLLQEELQNYEKSFSAVCQSCPALEAQSKKAEAEMKETARRNEVLESAVERIKEELEKEANYRKKLEKSYRETSEEQERKEKQLQLKVEHSAQQYKDLLLASRKAFHRIKDDMNRLTQERQEVNTELIRLQTENDNLIGKNSTHSQVMQNEIINLPDSMEDMQLLLLKYREDIIATKVAKEHLEETLNSKTLFHNDQLESERYERRVMEERLIAENEILRKTSENHNSLEKQLSAEQEMRIDLEGKLKIAEQRCRETITRSQHFIDGLKKQIEEKEQKRSELETVIADLKIRVSSLQQDLKNSEVVQRDFVRLSQSLQVQLEKIRQSEKEVRWQYEEDIDNCSNCEQKFTGVGRRKHHCKHCGKIFCNDCLTKTVPSGPSHRTTRVCDVCHTLLVADATPFFSSEPLNSPG